MTSSTTLVLPTGEDRVGAPSPHRTRVMLAFWLMSRLSRRAADGVKRGVSERMAA